ncbi:putative nitrate transport protein NrtA [Acetobacter nitrogenifigens DSM 23921 = NBRC 105050]|uniref:ABC transporter substrate-binding protein n=1 Tax=Acetobacter nitrogenifigens DSM 23921 = NBRC 105050 TaxID=1120919 RepID=A0A511XCD3_9PROT|nr:ABC transporter substrate-binding protein [Acetobacter nitrogenifigens]GBQ94193.1 putative nitrate transport protein NrtA [Acetobacter nitrogenifigens DSM 23921 = NBRC 105050]GEN60541.1 ABC transporter substrate-binding protein [Acetobacter nitrogenifigens DSM 23921 = NBRC 105050]
MKSSYALSRRSTLGLLAGAALPFAARADGPHDMNCMPASGDSPAPAPSGPPRKVTIAWNETAVCTAAVPVAKAKGFFARRNIDVDYVNFAGSTDQLLEALSTGKADGAPGMALRWLKPLQQGFDVKLVAGLHAGCMFLMTTPTSGLSKLQDLRGKTIGVTDIGGPDRNFFSIRLKEAGVDPETDVQWRQFPVDLLPVALQRGEVQAFSDGDPFSTMQKKQFGLVEIDSNMRDKWAHTTCCVVGLRGSLIRDDPATATGVARAILEAGAWLSCNPDEAAEIFKPYAPKANAADLAAIIRAQGHHHQTSGAAFRDEIVLYADALKQVGVFRPSLDSHRYAERFTQDLFSS